MELETITFTKEDVVDGRVVDKTFIQVSPRTIVCVLTLSDRYEVAGVSTCVDMRCMDLEVEKKTAYEDAVNRLFQLNAYRVYIEQRKIWNNLKEL